MNTKRSIELREDVATEWDRPHLGPHGFEPDWWSRLMAVGSMLVAAAALWFAQHGGTPSTEQPNTVASVVGTDDAPPSNPQNEDASPPESKDDTSSENASEALSPTAIELLVAQKADFLVAEEARVKELADLKEQLASAKASLLERTSVLDDAPQHVSSLEHAVKSATETINRVTALKATNGDELMPETDSKETGGPIPPTKVDDEDADENEQDQDSSSKSDSIATDNEELDDTLAEFTADTELVDVPDVSEAKDDDDSETTDKEVADTQPTLDSIQLDGNKSSENGLVRVKVVSQPLASEYGITLTIRNNGEEAAEITRVVFRPLEVINNVSTEFATKPFVTSSPSEFAIVFTEVDNQAIDPSEQGRYAQLQTKRIEVPADAPVDLRLAIANKDHIGYGMLGTLDIEYTLDGAPQTLTVNGTPLAFISGSNANDDE